MAKDFANGWALVRKVAAEAGIIEVGDGDDLAGQKIAAALGPAEAPVEDDGE